MKYLILSVLVISSAMAHTITGTPILKGSLKTKVTVNTVETECRVKVEKVKNLLEEDSFGNPAYNVRVNIALSGKDLKKKIEVKLDRDFQFRNLYADGVRDYEYFSDEGATLKIKTDGRLQSVVVPYGTQKVTCNF